MLEKIDRDLVLGPPDRIRQPKLLDIGGRQAAVLVVDRDAHGLDPARGVVGLHGGELPLVGEALFRQHPLVYATILLVPAAWLLFWRTRTGLVLRAVGESPDAAHALGYRVRFIRLGAVLCGGFLCGLAGAYLSVAHSNLWNQGMVAGRGWIALSLTVFATWRPARLLLGAYLFGGLDVLQQALQIQGVQIPAEFLGMLPYVSTIVVLCLISRNPTWIRLNMPASLGKPFFPSQ